MSGIFYILNDRKVYAFFPRATAETQIRNVDFTTYSYKIQALKTKIADSYSPEVMSELSMLVDGAYDHLPDGGDKYANKQLYDKVKKSIANYNLHRAEMDRNILEDAVDSFLEEAETYSIQGNITATPANGESPLSVTLEGRDIVDTSGTTIPEENYTWWLRTPSGPQILGRGKTVNYIFEDEGTYTVYLTVNSGSKNNRGFVDVISFEGQAKVEVGQAKLKFIIYFNDQLATDRAKISTIEATQKVIIDATQTKFASGYTVTKTEWDFGNGKTMTREGMPLVETQEYKEGEYVIKVKFTRNDGEVFTRSVTLKVGDPIAGITVSNKQPNKGDTVVFQVKKVFQEGVTYFWEIKKFGVEQPVYTAPGPRIEYTFRDVGQYSVGLIATK